MKLSPEIIQKIRALEIHTRRILSGSSSGDYTSKKRGFGLEFDQLRDYQAGDDVRSIDWKSTARSNTMLVREYIQDRNKTIMLVVDGSASMRYASSTQDFKSDIASQVASILALASSAMRDNVGLILVTPDHKHTIIAPGRGRAHVHAIMEKLFTYEPYGAVSLADGLRTVLQMNKKDMIVFVISDFLTTGYEKVLKMCSRRHETVAIYCHDPLEHTFIDVGLLTVKDPETGATGVLSTGSASLQQVLDGQKNHCLNVCKRARVDSMTLTINKPFMSDLVKFFKKRVV